jgi:hypothetical protein
MSPHAVPRFRWLERLLDTRRARGGHADTLVTR